MPCRLCCAAAAVPAWDPYVVARSFPAAPAYALLRLSIPPVLQPLMLQPSLQPAPLAKPTLPLGYPSCPCCAPPTQSATPAALLSRPYPAATSHPFAATRYRLSTLLKVQPRQRAKSPAAALVCRAPVAAAEFAVAPAEVAAVHGPLQRPKLLLLCPMRQVALAPLIQLPTPLSSPLRPQLPQPQPTLHLNSSRL